MSNLAEGHDAHEQVSPASTSVSLDFSYSQPQRVVRFGHGARHELGSLLAELGRSRVFALTSPSQRAAWREIMQSAGVQCVGSIEHGRPHVPLESVGPAVEKVVTASADVLVSIGGGSLTGLAKAVAEQTGRPYVALPTTYSGSEMTDFFGVTVDGRKEAHRTPLAASRAVIYDPELTYSMPPRLTGSSGINAMAQAIGSLWTPPSNPISQMHAAAAVRHMIDALPGCVDRPTDPIARSQALLGAHLCGLALSATGSSPHHELVYRVSDLTDLAHAELHTVFLPQTTAWAVEHRPLVRDVLIRELGPDPAGALADLLARLRVAPGLSALGLDRTAWGRARRSLLAEPTPSWTACLDGLAELLDRTYEGGRPPTP